MRFFIKNFGCRLNQHEGDIIAESLLGADFQRASFQNADIVIVNGCTVTGKADQKVRQFIHKIKRENPGARIILVSCTAEAIDKNLLDDLAGVEAITGLQRFNLANYLEKIMSENQFSGDFINIKGTGILRTRAWLKIQDGCDRKCAYCIVPLVRGNSRSRHADDIVAQIHNLVEAGFKEVVFTGVDIGDWHRNEMRLPALLQKILDETKISRIRLSSIEPPGITEKLAELISNEPRIAPHLHIPIQSGSQNVLDAMNRPKYRVSELFAKIEKIRIARLDFCFGTDIIVGFPIESEDDFSQTVNLLESGKIAYAHLFRFSPRPGTTANEMKLIDPKIINERTKLLKVIDLNNRRKFAEKFVGQTMEILVEQVRAEKAIGHTPNYLRAIAEGTATRGSVVKVLAQSSEPMQICGKIIS